jgi:hypothetical protein
MQCGLADWTHFWAMISVYVNGIHIPEDRGTSVTKWTHNKSEEVPYISGVSLQWNESILLYRINAWEMFNTKVSYL